MFYILNSIYLYLYPTHLNKMLIDIRSMVIYFNLIKNLIQSGYKFPIELFEYYCFAMGFFNINIIKLYIRIK